jgi:hypothetical protein
MYILTLLNVDDPNYDYFNLEATSQAPTPCLLPQEQWGRCGNLPIGSFMRGFRAYLPLVQR